MSAQQSMIFYSPTNFNSIQGPGAFFGWLQMFGIRGEEELQRRICPLHWKEMSWVGGSDSGNWTCSNLLLLLSWYASLMFGVTIDVLVSFLTLQLKS